MKKKKKKTMKKLPIGSHIQVVGSGAGGVIERYVKNPLGLHARILFDDEETWNDIPIEEIIPVPLPTQQKVGDVCL